MADPEDEGRHPPGDDRWWSESWYFDFAARDGSVGGYVRLGFYPNQKVAWWWAYLVGKDRPLIALRTHEAPVPRRGLELRDEGLWVCLTPESPNDHWSIGMEAFAVSLDDPLEAYRGERGDRVPFGLDLEWEAVAPVFDYPGVTRYEQSCNVYGEILVGDERIMFDGPGQRDHSWGPRRWWELNWCWTAGALDDDRRYHGCNVELGPDAHFTPGYVASGGELAGLFGWELDTTLDAEGLATQASMQFGSLDLRIVPIAFAPILLEEAGSDNVSRFPRAMCQVESADGHSGMAWTEWNQPQGQAPAPP